MPIVRTDRPLVSVTPELPDEDVEANEDSDSVKCGRCRLNFIRHPSIGAGDPPKWWVCPQCRSRLTGEESRTNLRRARKT